MANILMRMAAVKAATQSVPRALLALCSIMLPMAVIENCKPIGTPILSSVEQCRRDIVRSSREARRMSNLRII